jgi:hypothetical protein
VRVRIIQTPVERELDGLKLDGFVRGVVVDVTPAVALWLIAEHYAVAEMRQAPVEHAPGSPASVHIAGDRRRS